MEAELADGEEEAWPLVLPLGGASNSRPPRRPLCGAGGGRDVWGTANLDASSDSLVDEAASSNLCFSRSSFMNLSAFTASASDIGGVQGKR